MADLKTYPKKRLSILIEAPFMKRLLALLDDLEVPGYTVLPALAGKGKNNFWSRDSLTSDAGRMVQVLVVLDEDAIPPVLRELKTVLDRQTGFVTVSDVEVLRPEYF